MKVAVIGLGGAGSAALRFLAEAGHDAVGFEQYALGHDRASSFGESRIIRYLYKDPIYTQMVGLAYPLWRDLEERAQAELLVTTGGIFLGLAGSARIAETRACLEAQGLPSECLDADTAMDRFPDFRLDDGEVALYQQDTGFLRSSLCITANLRLANEAGATIRAGTAIRLVEPRGAGVAVHTTLGEELFDRAVIAAGPWLTRLIPRTLPLRVTRQYFAYMGSSTFPLGIPVSNTFPAWVDIDSPECFYGIPHDGRVPGVKVAAHQLGPEVDPDAPADAVPAAELQRLREYTTFRFPRIDHEITHTKACVYTVTPDEAFIVDEVAPGIWLVSACSGHGFKFTVLLGQVASDLATGQPASIDLSGFSLSRFAV
ncbi:MAG: N-methyl-L-tryptophan oxidase [Capsulimonadaceae bacterium]